MDGPGTHVTGGPITEEGDVAVERGVTIAEVNGSNGKIMASAAQEAKRQRARKKMQNWFSTPSIEMMDEEGGLTQPEFLEASARRVEDNPLNLSCLAAVQALQATGRFGEAQLELEAAVQKATGKRDQAVACLLLAELLNRWGAASPEYTLDIMEKGADYSHRAAELLVALLEEGVEERREDVKLLRSAYFWQALNIGSVSGLGGCARWSCLDAMAQAENALARMVELDLGASADGSSGAAAAAAAPSENAAREKFVAGILLWCKANAILGGFRPDEGQAVPEYWQQALDLFLDAERGFRAALGEDNSETIKAVTMVAAAYRRLELREQALAWTEKEVEVRERVQGPIPRTKLAVETLLQLRGALGISVESGDEEEAQSAAQVREEEIVWSLNPFQLSDRWMIDALLQMFSAMGFMQRFRIAEGVLIKFLFAVRHLYHDHNSFHNWKHAWSATHCSYMMIRETGVGRLMDDRHRLAVLLSVLVHDLDHPGVNSDFLIKSASPIAINYPTPNVLEHMHWDRATGLLQDGAPTDILCELDAAEKRAVLDLIFEGIMATDMQNHKALMQDLGERVKRQQSGEPPFTPAEPADMRSLFKIVVHASDLSGQCMDPDVAYEFGKRVLEEFYNQAKMERAERLPESVFMKNLHVPLSQAKAQLGFLHYVVGPLWKHMCLLFPELEPLAAKVEERATEIDFDDLENWKGVNATLVEQGE